MSSSFSIFTTSPTAKGFVDVKPSILNFPFMRALYTLPDSFFTMYQLPVDLYTVAIMDSFYERYFPTIGILRPTPKALEDTLIMGQN